MDFRGIKQAVGKVECLVVEAFVLADSFLHKSLQLREMMLIDLSRRAGIFTAQGSGHPDHLAHHSGRAHHPDGSESDMRYADIPPGHEQIVYISGIEASVWHRAWIDPVMDGCSLEFPSWEIGSVLRIREMEVDAP